MRITLEVQEKPVEQVTKNNKKNNKKLNQEMLNKIKRNTGKQQIGSCAKHQRFM